MTALSRYPEPWDGTEAWLEDYLVRMYAGEIDMDCDEDCPEDCDGKHKYTFVTEWLPLFR